MNTELQSEVEVGSASAEVELASQSAASGERSSTEPLPVAPVPSPHGREVLPDGEAEPSSTPDDASRRVKAKAKAQRVRRALKRAEEISDPVKRYEALRAAGFIQAPPEASLPNTPRAHEAVETPEVKPGGPVASPPASPGEPSASAAAAPVPTGDVGSALTVMSDVGAFAGAIVGGVDGVMTRLAGVQALSEGERQLLTQTLVPVLIKYGAKIEASPEAILLGAVALVYAPRVGPMAARKLGF